MLCGLSNSMTALIICVEFKVLAAVMMMANSFTVIGDLFPPAERGKLWLYECRLRNIVRHWSCAGGFITDAISWHWVFFVNIPIGF